MLVGVGRPIDVGVGSAIAPIAAVVSDPAIAAVTVDQGTQRVTVIGKATGTTSVRISDARGLTRDVPVRVANYAGSIPQRISLALTGDPATAQFVREQVADAVKAPRSVVRAPK